MSKIYFIFCYKLFRRAVLFYPWVLLVTTGCAYSPSMPGLSSPLLENLQRPAIQDCSVFFVDIDEAIIAASVVDAGARRITGYPYLRIDRFLASFENLTDSELRFNQWVDRLQQLDQQSRSLELANLPGSVRDELENKYSILMPDKASLMDVVNYCGWQLRDIDMQTAENKADLLLYLDYPDEYKTFKRALGLYAISRYFVMNGVEKFADEVKKTFATPLEKLEIQGVLQRYVPLTVSGEPVSLSAAEVRKLVAASVNNALGIPEPSQNVRRALFATFAPVIEVDTSGEYDRIGAPVWQDEVFAQINSRSPVVYTLVSYVRFGGEILLQLNYVMWFPERPKEGTLDILGGHIDGITWRVTLGTDGRPLIYDSMHNCGCYHLFFPTPRLKLKALNDDLIEEALLAPQTVSEWEGGRFVLRIESKTHYLQRVYAVKTATGTIYRMDDYDQLRSMQYGDNGQKSLFAWDGIIKGTERGESWVLWPMGIPEPGAMRQWGRHATAFVGKRHFDDANLLERYFSNSLTE